MVLRVLTDNSKMIILSFWVVFGAGCANPSDEWRPDAPFRTQIIISHSEGVQIQEVELEGVRDRRTLKGDIVQFLYAPGEKNHQVIGQAPVARFMEDSRGVFIPADSVSLQMTTLYYHLQEMRRLELRANPKALIPWPRKVGIQVRSSNPNLKFNNAFYNSQYDMLFFAPYNKDRVPVALNGGVIAHELFHAYFAHIVSKFDKIMGANKLKKTSDESTGITHGEEGFDPLYLEYALKSLNEGLADMWGWIYTGDADFIMASLPAAGHDRSLEKPMSSQEKLKSKSQMESEISAFSRFQSCRDNPSQCATNYAYANGSVLARTLRAFGLAYQSQRKIESGKLQLEMAQKIFQLLEALRANLEKGTLDLESTVVSWSRLFSDLGPAECQVLKEVLSTPEESKKVCAH